MTNCKHENITLDIYPAVGRYGDVFLQCPDCCEYIDFLDLAEMGYKLVKDDE